MNINILSFSLLLILMDERNGKKTQADFWPKSASAPIKDNTDFAHLS